MAEKVDSILGKIRTDDITTTNDLIYAGAVLVNESKVEENAEKTGKRTPERFRKSG